ncbi:MAG: calcium-binding protein [Methylococcaceae bacterium]
MTTQTKLTRTPRIIITGTSTIEGSAGNDNLLGTDTINYLYGYAGNDTLNGGNNSDILDGGEGDDSLTDTDGFNKLIGGLGNDSLTAGAGDDTLDGGEGSDTLIGGTGHDSLTGGDGANSLDGGDGNDSLSSGIGNDTLIGGLGNDILNSGDGINILNSGDGNNTLTSGSGNDTLIGGSGNDVLNSGDGNNSLNSGDGNNTLISGSGDDTLIGGTGSDVLNSGDGLNNLNGGDGNDTLTSGINNDNLNGGAGHDVLNSGIGNDTLKGDTGDDTLNAGVGGDIAVYNSTYADAVITNINKNIIITTPSDGKDTLTDIETLQFSDKAMKVLYVYGETLVNTTTANIQNGSSVTALADGSTVITWSSLAQDGDNYGIYGQRYNVDGTPAGSEFRVNTSTAKEQSDASVTALVNGGFVVTWSSMQNNGYWDVYGQRYNADGTASGSELHITTAGTNQFQSNVTALVNGSFVVTWTSENQDGSSWGVYGQRYNADGTTVGSEFRINTYTNDNQSGPNVTALVNGGFVATWHSYWQDGSLWGVYGQRYNADGTAAGSEFRINTTTVKDQVWPSVTALVNGGFVATWISDKQDGSGYGIYGQRYNADGTAAGVEFRINTTTANNQSEPSITALVNGGFVVTWTDNVKDGNGNGVYGQRYNADGTAVGGEFLVNTITTGNQDGSNVTALADGGFMVTYHSNGDIYSQRFDSDGKTLGLAVTNVITNHLPTGAVTITGNTINGQVLTANNNLQDADGLGVITYTWQANNISIGTGNTYQLTSNEIGKTITAIANYTDLLGTSEHVNSNTTAAVIDAIPAGVIIKGTDFITSEQGDTATFNISLKSAPVRDVSMSFTSSDITEGVITGNATLVFNATNWSTPQNLTITGQNDALIDGNIAYSINGKITSLDVFYKSVTVNSLTLTNQDTPVIAAETINGTDGIDILQGTEKPSYLLGKAGDDDISGGAGNDTLYGSYGNDVLFGEDANDVVYGEQDADYLDGGKGNDTLDGGLGLDTLVGGVGNDTYYLGYDATDVIQDNGLSSDIDTVIMPYQLSSYTLPAGIEKGTITTGTTASNLTGNTADNTLTGNNGKNVLNGSTGRDSLFGGAGNDTLMGGVGNDQLKGDVGKDVFKFDVTPNTANADSISDFKVVDDTIQLKATAFKGLVKGTLAISDFVVATAAIDNTDHIIYNKGTGVVYFDDDGNGAHAAVPIVTLSANLGLTNTDFVVI